MGDFEVRENEHWCREVLSELGTFHAACIYKTRRRAGMKLDKEGQSVGRSITRLETLLKDALNGGSLVDPGEQRKVEPTDAGKLLQGFCEHLALARAKLLSDLAALQHSSELRIAATHYAWLAYGSDLEQAYAEMRPGGVLNHGENFWEQDRVWEEIEARVIDGAANVGIYSYPPSRKKEFPTELEAINWIDEEFVLVLSRDLVKRVRGESPSIYDLSFQLPMLPKVVHYRRELNFDRTDLIEDYLRRQRVLSRFDGDWLTGVSTIAEIKETLIQKGGISFLPWPAVSQEHAKGLLKAYPLIAGMLPRTIKIIFRRHNGLAVVQDFLKAAAKLAGPRNFKAAK